MSTQGRTPAYAAATFLPPRAGHAGNHLYFEDHLQQTVSGSLPDSSTCGPSSGIGATDGFVAANLKGSAFLGTGVQTSVARCPAQVPFLDCGLSPEA